MDAVQASLSSLPRTLHTQHLLSCLLSACEQQLLAERRAEQWKQKCDKVRQRLRGLRAEIDELHADMEEPTPHMNGAEEKQSSIDRPQPSQPSPATSLPSQHLLDSTIDSTFDGFGDYSSLLAATEARLEVARRQRQSQQPPVPAAATLHTSASVCSSPYYHHDHTLTGAGKQLVRSILQLASPTGDIDLSQLQRLCERLGRTSATVVAAGSDDDGDVWWLWQSYVSEDEDGGQSMRQAEMEQLYEQEWNVGEDARRLGLI